MIEPSKLSQWGLLGIFSHVVQKLTLYDFIFASKNNLALVTFLYYRKVLLFPFTADRFSVEFYNSNLLSDQPPYFCICISFFSTFPKTIVCDNFIRACKVAGVVVCPGNICRSIPKVDRPLFLKPSRLRVRFFIRSTC